MEETLQHFKALDVLINNAGMMHTENLQKLTGNIKVSLLGVVALWGDCTFIPADWGS
jgi:short-subunit dehydrogenase involved in D-alanine esterification of teichoic acids